MSTDGRNVSVDSVLVGPELCECVAWTVLTAEPFFRWLPQDEQLSRQFGNRLPLRRVFRTAGDVSLTLDKDDPYASPLAHRRSIPAPFVRKLLSIESLQPYASAWGGRGGQVVFRSGAWGGVPAHGRVEQRTGHRQQMSAQPLLQLLTRLRRSLVILVNVQKHLPDDARVAAAGRRRRQRRPDGNVHFRTQTLVAIVDNSGGVREVRGVPSAIRSVIDNVPEGRRYDFSQRWLAIERALATDTRIRGRA